MKKLPVESSNTQFSASQDSLFIPTANERVLYGNYRLEEPGLLIKPSDVPDDYIAYNPSAIWTVEKDTDVMYVRVEPDRSDPQSSHLGKSVVRPYIVNPRDASAPLRPYDKAPEMVGEDAALTRIHRRLPISNILEEVWLLSYVDPKPKADKPNEVETLRTRFWCGTDLTKLEHIADGPEWMKDIRVTNADGPLGTELALYGRPQPQANSGNITYATINSLDSLTPEVIAGASYIDEQLLPVGSGVWGGVNDVIRHTNEMNILLAHRAWRQGVGGVGRHYESILYGHNTVTNRIVELGVLATADMFPAGPIKSDSGVDLGDVVFTGGGYNGTLEYATFGVRDGSIGIGKLAGS
jgi:hypothetical protein